MTVDGVRCHCPKCHGVFHEVEIWEDGVCYPCYKKEKEDEK